MRVKPLLVLVLALGAASCGRDALSIPSQQTSAPVNSAPAPSVPQKGRAVLWSGTAPQKGLSFLGRNSISSLAATYSIRLADGTAGLVSVWYSDEALVIPKDWAVLTLRTLDRGVSLKEAPTGVAKPGNRLLVMETAQYRLFAELPSGYAATEVFLAKLLERFEWFRSRAARPEDLSFPALLEAPGL